MQRNWPGVFGLSWAVAVGWMAMTLPSGAAAQDGAVRLIVRADDLGSSHTANEAILQCYKQGLVRSVEVMVPAPWYPEAVKLLKANPGLDVGVHLTLTSEWSLCKWGPVTQAPSLVDRRGRFYPTTQQRPGFPPNSAFLPAGPKLEEVERELRAQIELAVADIPQVSHLSTHMDTPTATPQLRAIVEKLSREYRLPLEVPGARWAGGFGAGTDPPEAREAALARLLEGLAPGTWILVEHPGLDTPEMRALGHPGYESVAADRAGVTRAFTGEKVRKVVERRGIRLMSYAEALKEARS